MKKLLSLILAVTVCLSVCACAKGEDNNSSAETSADNTESGSAKRTAFCKHTYYVLRFM